MSDEFDDVMLDLAKTVASKAKLQSTLLVESIDALKALTGYYTVRLKHKEPDEDDKGASFDDFQAQLSAPEESSSGAIPGRRRRSSGDSVSESH